MTLNRFRALKRHFRIIKESTLPGRDEEGYHPLQNIKAGVEYLRIKSTSLWSPGPTLCADEGRVRSKSKRNPYKTRNPDKPIRMGWTVDKVVDKGEQGGYFTLNHLVKVLES